jgi:aspartyl-tRNA(Asn)/glutamyl-tRNA(Gln) amidotransferase subunit A
VVNARLLDEHFDALDPVVAQRMITGRELRAPEYVARLRQWAALRARIAERLRDVDALLVPTTMIPARPLADIDRGFETYMAHNVKYLRNTSIGNTLNLCAVSLPCGLTREGLPISLMVYGKSFAEDVVLRVAYAYEQATEWHTRRPDLSWAGGPSH